MDNFDLFGLRQRAAADAFTLCFSARQRPSEFTYDLV